VRCDRRRLRGDHAFPAQVVNRVAIPRQQLRRLTACLLLLLIAASSTHAQGPPPASPGRGTVDPKDFADFALTTGDQVAKSRLDQLLSDRDVRAAQAYLESRKLRFHPEALVDARMRRLSTKETAWVSFLPYSDRGPGTIPGFLPSVGGGAPVGISGGQQPTVTVHNVVFVARLEKMPSKVSVGTVTTDAKGDVAVIEDNGAIDGKIVQGQGRLKAFFECAVPGCAAALACRLSGPGWFPCFCAWCGFGAIACGVFKVFFP
jgi:hypothetical protein